MAVRLPVQWGEMDAYGHVNNTVFFRWFESARVEYFRRCGFLRSWEEERVGAILHSTSCRFRRPVHFPDTVVAAARAAEVSDDRFAMEYRVWSETERGVVAEGSGLVVSYDYRAGARAPIPAEVRRGIEELEGRLRTPDAGPRRRGSPSG